MAISMSNATIDNSNRQDFINSEVTEGGGIGFLSAMGGSYSLVGITEDFASSVSTEIETYISAIKNKINELENVSRGNAFKGSGIDDALKKFIDAVKDCATKYCDALSSVEKQIITSVENVYTTQDSELASNMESETSTVSNFTPNVSGNGE